MGYYIETSSSTNKAAEICANHNARRVTQEGAERAFDDGKGVICVVDNGPFEAAAFIYSKREFDEFSQANDFRPRTWLVMDRNEAEQLSGFKG